MLSFLLSLNIKVENNGATFFAFLNFMINNSSTISLYCISCFDSEEGVTSGLFYCETLSK